MILKNLCKLGDNTVIAGPRDKAHVILENVGRV